MYSTVCLYNNNIQLYACISKPYCLKVQELGLYILAAINPVFKADLLCSMWAKGEKFPSTERNIKSYIIRQQQNLNQNPAEPTMQFIAGQHCLSRYLLLSVNYIIILHYIQVLAVLGISGVSVTDVTRYCKIVTFFE